MYEAAIGLRMALRKSLAVSAFTFCVVSSGWAAKDSVPDWVRAAAAQQIPAYSPRTNAVILLDDTTYTVAPDGRATEHYRRVVKILRPQGRDEGIVHNRHARHEDRVAIAGSQGVIYGRG